MQSKFSALSSEEYLELVRKHGRNPQSLLGAYPTFERTKIAGGAGIAFQKKGKTLFTVGTPVGPSENFAPSIDWLKAQFTGQSCKNTQSCDRINSVAMIAVLEPEAQKLEKLGFKIQLLGQDPFFDLPSWNADYSQFPAAKRLIADGAKVEMLDINTASSQDRNEFTALRNEWLNSRKIPPLGFLNQVDLWSAEEDKRYFRLRHRGRTVAVVIAIPAPEANTWYLIDLLRGSRALNGSSELLIFKAMEHLKQAGVQAVNLGMAPLVGVDRNSKWFAFIFKRFQFFYNFRSLYEFKLKLRPTRWEPTYLCAYPDFSTGNWLDFVHLVQPNPLFLTICSWIVRSVQHFPMDRKVHEGLRKGFVIDDFPQTLGELIKNARFTQMIAGILILFHAWVGSISQWGGNAILKNCVAFEYQTPFKYPCIPIFSSIFFHWNLFHLVFNLFILFLFGAIAETIYGWGKTLLIFFAASIGSQVCTTFVFFLFPHLNPIDLGASLGIFGLGGMIAWTFRRSYLLMGALIFGSALVAYLSQDLAQVNHIFAALIGFGMSQWFFQPKKRVL